MDQIGTCVGIWLGNNQYVFGREGYFFD